MEVRGGREGEQGEVQRLTARWSDKAKPPPREETWRKAPTRSDWVGSAGSYRQNDCVFYRFTDERVIIKPPAKLRLHDKELKTHNGRKHWINMIVIRDGRGCQETPPDIHSDGVREIHEDSWKGG